MSVLVCACSLGHKQGPIYMRRRQTPCRSTQKTCPNECSNEVVPPTHSSNGAPATGQPTSKTTAQPQQPFNSMSAPTNPKRRMPSRNLQSQEVTDDGACTSPLFPAVVRPPAHTGPTVRSLPQRRKNEKNNKPRGACGKAWRIKNKSKAKGCRLVITPWQEDNGYAPLAD